MLEAAVHKRTCVATLTYNDDCIPDGGSLVPTHTQLFLKKLRKQHPLKIRYFLVGEYGDETERPHYHVAFFGLSIYDHPTIQKAWTHGHTHVMELNPVTAAYTCGYVMKKFGELDNEWLSGRHREFARMSLRPGIGAQAATYIADSTKDYSERTHATDVPGVFRYGAKSFPLGRYLRGLLRERYGYADRREPEAGRIERDQKLRAMQIAASDDPSNPFKAYTGKTRLAEKDAQTALNMTTKALNRRKGKI